MSTDITLLRLFHPRLDLLLQMLHVWRVIVAQLMYAAITGKMAPMLGRIPEDVKK